MYQEVLFAAAGRDKQLKSIGKKHDFIYYLKLSAHRADDFYSFFK